MPCRPVTIALCTLWVAATASAADPANGRKLVETRCTTSCHGSEFYTRPERKVRSLAALGNQVRMCDHNLNLTWFDEEIADVVAHLNREYYHFP